MVLWPEALPKLKAARDHWVRRLDRMELLALGGRFVRPGDDPIVGMAAFPEARAYVHGLRDGTQDAVDLLESERVMPMPLDLAIIELVRGSADIETIAEQCGCTVREVADILARLARGQDTEPS